ncbi:hypothetical protein H3Z85_19195 [Chryseobacterium indologenes]|uniref:ORC-CDC6 family AAA ATPase n=1 Tax=Chryseobacterium indologenes TaxID=253 RepID=UPI0003E0634C|nr:DNA-directed RNA polymerase subunit alpha C-terminal domain-containing protein [Chryseobacterium indologenes]QPQ51391.1 hypothetical protein H3Z85_19195 [Chryseobacterium indologenes]GAE65292.1 hypothetical protein CIN01S_10_03100 [Chryseobacterium indologenes NBRC 14944]SFI90651.1 RNA polymerase, alpha chain C terminal domain [Chryseobacterium indologenes]SUX49818.1 Uncharacterised protein [Chryseobacterium indologenes]
MSDLLFRTEDIPNDEILSLFVETSQDRDVIEKLKSISPIILVGSRGVGKSFLMKVSEEELNKSFKNGKVLPVYLTFNKSSLIHSQDKQQFTNWMLSLICSKIIRQLRKKGLLANLPHSINVLSGGTYSEDLLKIEEVAKSYEESWKNPTEEIAITSIPTVDDFKDAVQEICEDLGIKRINLLIDEAAHIFRPEQQRQFFTLFRDLRSPFISCNAAVYPGVTSYGDIFQYSQDATFININRDILSNSYIERMREIVEKQANSDSKLLNEISRNRNNFEILAYAGSGNPRFLLKTISRTSNVSSSQLNETIREFYKIELLAEHTNLSEKYPGQKGLIDWGRNFIENIVLLELNKKNNNYLLSDKQTSCFIWIHKDIPQTVKEALRLLEYTGIIQEHGKGIKSSTSEVGTRYLINLGCLFGQEATPSSTSLSIARNLTPKKMTEFGMNNINFKPLVDEIPNFTENDTTEILEKELSKSIDVLDLTSWIKETLRTININTINDILNTTETNLKRAHYVGDKRARLVKSAATASVYEYLNG